MALPDSGETGVAIPYNTQTYMTIAAFTAIAWYNVIELNIQVFMTFKRHRGLYFWSLLISSYGCVLHALGFLLKFFQLTTNNYFSVTIITIGWYCMVTGQAVVLYSRLHLVVREQKILRSVLAMIIVDAFCFHIPTTVLTYGSNSSDSVEFTTAFNIVERMQMTAFCMQEFIISGIYVYSTIKLLRPVYHGRTRRVMMQLIWINLIIIAMDVVLLAMEYTNNYEVEATLKAMVYSIKLKLEFAVLNQLMTLANSSVSSATHLTLNDQEGPSPTQEPKGRSKSMNYLTRHAHYANKSFDKPKQASPFPSPNTRSDSFTTNNSGRLKWVPSLDRNCILKTEHIEVANEPHNVFTNPAACWNPGNTKSSGFPQHDGLGRIPDTPLSPLSPALSGTTLNHSSKNVSGCRAPPLLQLDFDRMHMPQVGGVLRSNRPSVTDWAHGPDSESTPGCDEIHLNPYDREVEPGPRSPPPGDVRTGRLRASDSVGMDFMTSALQDSARRR